MDKRPLIFDYMAERKCDALDLQKKYIYSSQEDMNLLCTDDGHTPFIESSRAEVELMTKTEQICESDDDDDFIVPMFTTMPSMLEIEA